MSDKRDSSPGDPRRFFSFSISVCYAALAFFSAALIAGFVLIDSLAPAGRRLAKIGGVDSPSYFGVAHSLVFDRDFDLSNEFQRVPPDENAWTRARPETGHPGSIWPLGYSLLATPFLAAGTAIDALAGNPADGYSRFAILGYCLTNVVLTCIGLAALFTFLQRTAMQWGVPAPQAGAYALLVTGATFLGTSVGYFTFSQMSHAAEFCFMSLFLGYWWRVRERTDLRSWAILGFIGGVLLLCRWQDALYLAAPVMFDLTQRGVHKDIGLRLRNFSLYGGVAALCWLPQGLELKYIYGSFRLVPPAMTERYFVFPPQFILQTLFSTRSGWFPATPLALVGVCGLLFGLMKMSRVFLPWLVAFALEVALVGSAVTWHGGDTFSNRYLTSGIPLIAAGLITILCAATPGIRKIVIAGIVACCMFTVLSVLQFRLDLVPRSDRLTVAEYFTDKFRLPQVRHRKLIIRQAEDLMQGSPDAAVQSLEGAAKTYGVDRDLLRLLAKAYRKSGREAEADSTDRQWKALMASRLW